MDLEFYDPVAKVVFSLVSGGTPLTVPLPGDKAEVPSAAQPGSVELVAAKSRHFYYEAATGRLAKIRLIC